MSLEMQPPKIMWLKEVGGQVVHAAGEPVPLFSFPARFLLECFARFPPHTPQLTNMYSSCVFLDLVRFACLAHFPPLHRLVRGSRIGRGCDECTFSSS